jgi:hypothetical protein
MGIHHARVLATVAAISTVMLLSAADDGGAGTPTTASERPVVRDCKPL